MVDFGKVSSTAMQLQGISKSAMTLNEPLPGDSGDDPEAPTSIILRLSYRGFGWSCMELDFRGHSVGTRFMLGTTPAFDDAAGLLECTLHGLHAAGARPRGPRDQPAVEDRLVTEFARCPTNRRQSMSRQRQKNCHLGLSCPVSKEVAIWIIWLTYGAFYFSPHEHLGGSAGDASARRARWSGTQR